MPKLSVLLEGEKKQQNLPLASQVREALDVQILYRKSARHEKDTAFVSTLYYLDTTKTVSSKFTYKE